MCPLYTTAVVVTESECARVPELPLPTHPHRTPPPEPPAHPAPESPLPARDVWLVWDRFVAHIAPAIEALLCLHRDVHSRLPKPDMGQVISLSANYGTPLETFGRTYYRLLLTAAASVVFETPTGAITLSLSAGWNVINLPDGTRMTLASGGPTNVYALASDHING